MTLGDSVAEISGAVSRAGLLAGTQNLFTPSCWYADGKTYFTYQGVYQDDGFGQGYVIIYDEKDGVMGPYRITSTEPISDTHTVPSFIVDKDGIPYMMQERTHGSPIDIYKSGYANDVNFFSFLSEKIGGVSATLGYMHLLIDDDGNGITWCRFGTGENRHLAVVQASNGFENWGTPRRLSTSPGNPQAHYNVLPRHKNLIGDYWYVMGCNRVDEQINFQGWWWKYYLLKTKDFVTFENVIGTPYSHDTSSENYLTGTILDDHFKFFDAGDLGNNAYIPVSTMNEAGKFFCITGDDLNTGVLQLHIIDTGARTINTKPLNISDYVVNDPETRQGSSVRHLFATDSYLEIAIIIDEGAVDKPHLFRSFDEGDTWEDLGDMIPEVVTSVPVGPVVPENIHDIPANRNFGVFFLQNDGDTTNTRKVFVKRAAKGTIQPETPRIVVAAPTYDHASGLFHYRATDDAITRSGNDVSALVDQFGLRNAVGVNNPQWNGSDAIVFNGSDNYMSIPVDGLTSLTKITLLAVAKGSASNNIILLSFANNLSATEFIQWNLYNPATDSPWFRYRDSAGGKNLTELAQSVTNDDQYHLWVCVIDGRCKVDHYFNGLKNYYQSSADYVDINDFERRGKLNFGTVNSIRIASKDSSGTETFSALTLKEIIMYENVFDLDTQRQLEKKLADAHGITLNYGYQ